jgi:hypothetical protein
MSKQNWVQACNAAISRSLENATNYWGATVVSRVRANCSDVLRALAVAPDTAKVAFNGIHRLSLFSFVL